MSWGVLGPALALGPKGSYRSMRERGKEGRNAEGREQQGTIVT